MKQGGGPEMFQRLDARNKLTLPFKLQWAVTLIGMASLLGLAVACSRAAPTAEPPGTGGVPDSLPVTLSYSAEPEPTGQVKAYDLVVRQASWELLPGVTVPAITYNDTIPGPAILVKEGDTLQVTVKNELDQDTSIHWHGLHVPNDMDGVPGVTQAPIKPGETFIYQFPASHAGTFMYHPHINSVAQIDNGLYGLLVIEPQRPDTPVFDKEFSMMLGAWVVGNGPAHAQMDTMGRQMREMGTQMMDLESQMSMMGEMNGPMDDLRRQMGNMGQEMMGMGDQMEGAARQMEQGGGTMEDMGEPIEDWRRQMGDMVEEMMDMSGRMRDMGSQAGMEDQLGDIGQRLATMSDQMRAMSSQMGDITGPMDGAGGQMGGMNMDYNYFTINGKAYPASEPWTVREGDRVRVRLVNISNLAHPMHLHGQDFKVIAKDGEPIPQANQQWMNTLSVDSGETYDVAFIADNPGNWVFHCHELHHTENNGVEPGGLIQLIQYEGYQGYLQNAGPDAAAPMPPSLPGMGH